MNSKDWFKSKPYWFRVGIIVGIISLIFNGPISLFCSNSRVAGDWCFILFFTTLPLISLARLFSSSGLGLYIDKMFLPLTIITHFVIGAAFGLIIGKIKYRK